MNTDEKMKVLTRIWGADRDGYVFLPYIDGKANTKEKRRDSFHEGRAYVWPKDRAAIAEHISNHTEDDLYFTPALFNAKRRIEQNVDAERSLWADLDPVDPNSLGEYRPTIAWESSPGRYQAIWLLDKEKTGASWASQENHRLSLYLGADPSGWDSTQLLRVPGCINHKPEYGGSAEGKLLWSNGPRYQWDDFSDLPEVVSATPDDSSLLDEDLLASLDRHEVWARIRLSVSQRVREYIATRGEPSGDRSEVLWEMERELADAGCSLAEIVLLVRATVWNKYKGRADELTRLKAEAAKAIAAREADGAVIEEPARTEGIHWLSDITANPLPRPSWLVRDIWTTGGCGFISGAPKSYKSWMALDLGLSVATGTPFLGFEDYSCEEAPVMYLQEEDDLRLVMDRMAMILEGRAPERHWHGRMSLSGPETGADGSPGSGTHNGPNNAPTVYWEPPTAPIPLAVHVQTGFIASDPTWQAWLDDVVATNQFALVVIDTLGTTAGDVDTDRSSDVMGKILRPMRQIAKQHEVAICVVHHNKKDNGNGSSRAGQQMLGSTALHAWVDCALYARSKDKDLVHVEREAKMAMDFSMRLRIPKMYADTKTGERQTWQPEPHVTSDTMPSATPAAERKPKKRKIPWELKSALSGKGYAPQSRLRKSCTDAVVDAALEAGLLEEDVDVNNTPIYVKAWE